MPYSTPNSVFTRRVHLPLGVRFVIVIHAAKGALGGAAGAGGAVLTKAGGLFVLGVTPVVPAVGADLVAQRAVQQ